MPIGFVPSRVWSADTDCGEVSPLRRETVDCEDGTKLRTETRPCLFSVTGVCSEWLGLGLV